MSLRRGPFVRKSSSRKKAQTGSKVAARMWNTTEGKAANHSASPAWGLPTMPTNRRAAISMSASMITALSGHGKRMVYLLDSRPHSTILAVYAILMCLWPALGWAQPSGTVTVGPAANGFGTVSVSTSSVALSTLTAGPNSAAWKMPLNGTLFVINSASSSGVLYLCPFGGTCSASVGIPIAVGAAYGLNMGGLTVSPTVISASTSTAVMQW